MIGTELTESEEFCWIQALRILSNKMKSLVHWNWPNAVPNDFNLPELTLSSH